jgi:uncharacterized protein (TIGR02231 family)
MATSYALVEHLSWRAVMKILYALPFLISLTPVAGFADDIQTLAPVRSVTIYPNGATLTRVITADVPAGSHRVLFPIPQEALNSGPPRIRSKFGFELGAQEYLPDYVTDATLVYSPAQAIAFERLEGLKDQRLGLGDAVTRGNAAVEAAKAKAAFVRSISGSGLENVDVIALADVVAMIGEQVTGALAELQSATESLRADQEALDDLDKEIAQAQRDFDRTAPPRGSVGMMAVSVEASAEQTIEFTLEYLVRHASWAVDYDMFLDRDAAKLNVSRKILVRQYSDEVWSDVELIMSTANPFAQLVPGNANENPAWITENGKVGYSSAPRKLRDHAEGLAFDSEEAPVIAEIAANVVIDGLSVTYDYPQRVTISPNDGVLSLALGTFDLDAEEFNRAVPRVDETAFLMAKFTNSTPEPMLPGTTSLYRDGKYVGRGQVGMIPAGAEETLAFGPLEGLRLDYKRLNNDTGDTGIISRADTREQALEFSVENLTSEVEVVETLFALPFSEQEDLVVTARARPKPDAVDFEQRRNVGQWLLELQPGEKRTVRVDVEMTWPQGQQLQWQP